MTAPLNASLATVRVGGREYPAVVNPRCATCVHPLRSVVERRLAAGDAPAAIVDDLPEHLALTSRQIGDHFRAHLPLRDEGVALYRERVAEERGEVVRTAAESVVTALEFTQRVMTAVNARLASGEVVPGIGDGLKAAQVLAVIETTEPGDYSHDEVFTAFMIYMRVIKRHCTAEQMQDIGHDLGSDPVLRELSARQREIG